MRIHAIMCVKDEISRYLHASLQWHVNIFDSFFVYDDQSSDDTVDLVSLYRSATVVTRPDEIPSFIEHEGVFRQAAFTAFEKEVEPAFGDWVLMLDADEFLVTKHGYAYESLKHCAWAADEYGSMSSTIAMPEVWQIDPLKVRVDGFWGDLSHPRLFKYLPHAKFPMRKMGGGSVPEYVHDSKKHACNLVTILHYGYAHPDDAVAKFERYSGMAHGHNSDHINSILKVPVLQSWPGVVPDVWRGIRG